MNVYAFVTNETKTEKKKKKQNPNNSNAYSLTNYFIILRGNIVSAMMWLSLFCLIRVFCSVPSICELSQASTAFTRSFHTVFTSVRQYSRIYSVSVFSEEEKNCNRTHIFGFSFSSLIRTVTATAALTPDSGWFSLSFWTLDGWGGCWLWQRFNNVFVWLQRIDNMTQKRM